MTVTRLCECLTLSAALAMWVGCGDTPKPNATNKPAPSKGEHHEGDGHDHGKDKDGHADHAHPSEGPHHGHLIELGKEEYHAELTHDEATKTVTVYVLDGKTAKVAVPIEEQEITLNLAVDGKPSQFKLAAAPQEGDPEGQSSRYSLSDEALLEALESPKAAGRLTITIKGKPYSGKVEHAEHDEHEHEGKK